MKVTKFSYHGGHSGDFCDHAADTKLSLAEEYVRQGYSHVGIVEHIPPPDDTFLYDDEIANGHDSKFLMQRFDRYLTATRNLIRKRLGNNIHLVLGFETEFYGEKPVDRIVGLAEKYHPDFIVASVHHVDDIPIDDSAEQYEMAIKKAGGIESLYLRYYDHQFELIQHLPVLLDHKIPVVLGHFDLIRLLSPAYIPSDAVKSRIARNIKKAVENDCIFEVNARALKKGLDEPYPCLKILREIAKRKGMITLGDDSHSVSEVGHYYTQIVSIVKQFFDNIIVLEKTKESIAVKSCRVDLL